MVKFKKRIIKIVFLPVIFPFEIINKLFIVLGKNIYSLWIGFWIAAAIIISLFIVKAFNLAITVTNYLFLSNNKTINIELSQNYAALFLSSIVTFILMFLFLTFIESMYSSDR